MRHLLLTIGLVLLSLVVHAGWIIRETYRIPGSERAFNNTVYYQKNMVKTVDEAGVTIYDLSRREITFLDPVKRTFWKGTVEEYKKEVTASAIRILQQQLMDIPEGRRESYRELYENMIRDMENPAVTFYTDVVTKIDMSDEVRTIIGYNTRKYHFFADDFLREELWITDKVKIGDEVDLLLLNLMLGELMMLGTGSDYRVSPDYIHLMKSGYPLRVKEFDGEGGMETEVRKIENTRIPESEFRVPSNFRKVSLGEIIPG